ncbi:MAG: hypothetical protein GX304_04000 [Clostridiales bacterium]|nr:hypothetical protein [Clostridiales bacterium]
MKDVLLTYLNSRLVKRILNPINSAGYTVENMTMSLCPLSMRYFVAR